MGVPAETSTPLPIRIDLAGLTLNGDLALPPDGRGLVIFAHGSGSSRHSPRNRAVAEVLQRGRLGTLLLDLLTEAEERVDAFTAELRFDIPLLAGRLAGAIEWARTHPQTASLPVGLFGASTGAAAALIAASQHREAVRAVVSRGGRPDLAGDALGLVKAPTLLIVGGRDEVVIELNREALARLKADKALEIVPGATHLFEEPGALDEVSDLAKRWFERHLVVEASTPRRFTDRMQAGRILAERLQSYADRPDVIVLALPRGGVPVGFAVARALRVPLEVFVVRKLGVPGHEELAMGAIASGGVRVLNHEVVDMVGIPPDAIERVASREAQELERRERAYRDGRAFPNLKNRTVILVDDGLATGSSMRAAARALRRHEPSRVVIAVPAAARETCDALRAEVDGIVCAMTPEPFYAVGLWYEDFSQTTDEEVRDLLARSA